MLNKWLQAGYVIAIVIHRPHCAADDDTGKMLTHDLDPYEHLVLKEGWDLAICITLDSSHDKILGAIVIPESLAVLITGYFESAFHFLRLMVVIGPESLHAQPAANVPDILEDHLGQQGLK